MIKISSPNANVTFKIRYEEYLLPQQLNYVTYSNLQHIYEGAETYPSIIPEENITGLSKSILKNKKPTISSGFKFREILAMTYLPKTKGLSIFGARAFYF